MLKVSIISTGKNSQSFTLEGEAEFLKRLKTMAKVELIELPALSRSSAEQRKAEEGAAALKRIPERSFVIACDEKGKQLSSQQFASKIEASMNQGVSQIVFVVGGAFGLSEELLRRADLKLSFSAMTFPRQLFRLILVEQVYRAMSLIAGQPYHKD